MARKPKGWRTTKRHYRLFQEEVRKFQKDWGINGWVLEFEHSKLEPGYLAMVERDFGQGQALISFSTFWEVEPIQENLRSIAKHELLHVILGRMRGLATTRFCSEGELDAAEHELINLLETITI